MGRALELTLTVRLAWAIFLPLGTRVSIQVLVGERVYDNEYKIW